VRETLIPILRCPSCAREGSWDVRADHRDAREIREGTITCTACEVARPVQDGIVDLLDSPPEFVRREAAGLGRFAQQMRADGWDRKRVLELPYEPHGYWYNQATAMEQVLEGGVAGVGLSPGLRILDLGSNTCWASAMLAERGLEVVALDIAVHEMQGLRTADWWFEAKDIYFERVLSVMFAPALASGAFDAVWCCEVLHHNHRANLDRTLRELYRVLKPGGQLIVVNEPVRALRSLKLRPGADVAQFEGHEHAYLRRSYVRAAWAAGFQLRVFGPSRLGSCSEGTLGISNRMTSREGFKVALAHAIRRHRRLRDAYLAWKTYVDGISAHLIATKPYVEISTDAVKRSSAAADVRD
jgi:SAM-dependent methyltransferase